MTDGRKNGPASVAAADVDDYCDATNVDGNFAYYCIKEDGHTGNHRDSKGREWAENVHFHKKPWYLRLLWWLVNKLDPVECEE